MADRRGGAKNVNAWDLLPAARDLYSRLPETRRPHAWELQTVLWSLGYADDLAAEAEIAAAMDVARTDFEEAA